MRLGRRDLLKRAGLAVAALAAAPIAATVAAPAPVEAAPSVPAPVVFNESAEADDLVRHRITIVPPPEFDQQLERAFQCPYGCRLSISYSIEDLAYRFMVHQPGERMFRVGAMLERLSSIDGAGHEMVQRLMFADARLHVKEYIALGRRDDTARIRAAIDRASRAGTPVRVA